MNRFFGSKLLSYIHIRIFAWQKHRPKLSPNRWLVYEWMCVCAYIIQFLFQSFANSRLLFIVLWMYFHFFYCFNTFSLYILTQIIISIFLPSNFRMENKWLNKKIETDSRHSAHRWMDLSQYIWIFKWKKKEKKTKEWIKRTQTLYLNR